MIKNKLFQYSPSKKHPNLPHALTYIRSYPCLWPFETWDILALSLLAEIVDNKPKNTQILYETLFNELIEHTGLHKDFSILSSTLPHMLLLLIKNRLYYVLKLSKRHLGHMPIWELSIALKMDLNV